MGDHTETNKIIYDPNIISYSKLLDIFWNTHSPTYMTGRQYMSIIFYHDDIQKHEAAEIKKQFEERKGRILYTEIAQFKNFYLAEGYHQKYYLQNTVKLYEELKSMYNSFDSLIFSTLAARINGYIAGYIDMPSLREELKYLEVPGKNYDRLVTLLERYK